MKKQEAASALADALVAVLPYAEDWLADMRIDKRESEREGFHSSELDESEENAVRHIKAARVALRLAGMLP